MPAPRRPHRCAAVRRSVRSPPVPEWRRRAGTHCCTACRRPGARSSRPATASARARPDARGSNPCALASLTTPRSERSAGSRDPAPARSPPDSRSPGRHPPGADHTEWSPPRASQSRACTRWAAAARPLLTHRLWRTCCAEPRCWLRTCRSHSSPRPLQDVARNCLVGTHARQRRSVHGLGSGR